MEIKQVCVLGGGQMGRQIALCAALHGYSARVYDTIPSVLDQIRAWGADYLAGRVAKGKLTGEQAAQAEARFSVDGELRSAAGDADLIIEAIVEEHDVKAALFQALDGIIRPDAIVATNSSFMVSSQFAGCFADPSRLLNCHFYNPALVMRFVEVVQGPHTDPKYPPMVMEFCQSMGKAPVWMKKELPGFAANRIAAAISTEARHLVQNGYLTPHEVDRACELGLGHPMGPFRLMDLTGIDLNLAILKNQWNGDGPKPDCYDLIASMVQRGLLGRKTGRGFYNYEDV